LSISSRNTNQPQKKVDRKREASIDVGSHLARHSRLSVVEKLRLALLGRTLVKVPTSPLQTEKSVEIRKCRIHGIYTIRRIHDQAVGTRDGCTRCKEFEEMATLAILYPM